MLNTDGALGESLIAMDQTRCHGVLQLLGTQLLGCLDGLLVLLVLQLTGETKRLEVFQALVAL